MAKAYRLAVKVSGDSGDAKRALNDLNKTAKRTGDSIKRGLGMAARAGALAIGVGLVGAIKLGADEMVEMQKANAQTSAALKSTGHAANVTAKDIAKLSTSLLAKSGVDDQVVQSGANILLTFTNIRNEAGRGNKVFDQATRAALDMSVALGTDMKAAAMQVGKALNDPLKGMTKLQRIGVTFTDDQKKQVAALVKSGQSMKAQKIILAELNKEFGGSAAAYGKTLPAQISKTKEAIAGASATIMTMMLPAVRRAAEKAAELAARLQAWAQSKEGQAQLRSIGETAKRFGDNLATAVKIAYEFKGAIAVMIGGLYALKVALAAARTAQLLMNAATLLNPYVLLAGALVGLVAAVTAANGGFGRFSSTLKLASQDTRYVKIAFAQLAVDVVGSIADILEVIAKYGGAIPGMGAAAKVAAAGVKELRAKLQGQVDAQRAAVDASVAGTAAVRRAGDEARKAAMKQKTFADSILAAKSAWENWSPSGKNFEIRITEKMQREVRGSNAQTGPFAQPEFTQPKVAGMRVAMSRVAGASTGTINAIGAVKGAASEGQFSAYTKLNANPSKPFLEQRIALNRSGAKALIRKRNKIARLLRKARTAAQRTKLAGQLRDITTEIMGVFEAINVDSSLLGSDPGLDGLYGTDDDNPAATDATGDAEQATATATQAANDAENLRREALGLQSLEDEAHTNAINAIRLANGLPPLGAPGTGGDTGATGGATGGSTQVIQKFYYSYQPDQFVVSRQAAWAARTSGLVIR